LALFVHVYWCYPFAAYLFDRLKKHNHESIREKKTSEGVTMGKRILIGALMCALVLFLNVAGFSQESAVKGNLGGTVVDSTGAVVTGAKVTLTGATGSETTTSDNEGNFMFTRLIPGSYSVKVEKQGFKAANVKGVEVSIGRTSSLRLQMAPGATTETVEVTADAITVDTMSTANGANLSDSFYAAVPVPRNVSGLFYVAPGVADGGGTGRSNPSISGGSGLENLYIADGVNITDAAYGGLGIFTRQYGSVGSGINLSFIKEVQIKSGGFEPQYGQATGGVVQLVTKSGGDKFHGALEAFGAPREAQASHPSIDTLRNRKIGTDLLTSGGPASGLGVGPGSYDVNFEVGGYVPHIKNLYFFGSFNPNLNTDYSVPPQFAGSPLIQPIRTPVGLFTLQNGKPIYARAWTNSYAGKLTYRINDKNTFETSVFGDPTTTNNSAFRVVNAQNRTVYSNQSYQTRNFVGRYNGTMSPTWLINASMSWNHNDFTENAQNPNVFNITNATTSGLSQTLQGLGFMENHNTDNFAYTVDTSKSFHFGGQHTFMVGFNNQLLNYDDIKSRTGGFFAVPDLGARNAAIYGCAAPTGDPSCPLGFKMNAQYTLSARPACTLCPFMTPLAGGPPVHVAASLSRAEYGPPTVQTEGKYYAAYINDVWTINKYVNVSLGLRGEQYRMAGTAIHYTFTDNWAPRLGLVVDPKGDRKSKIYANFGRYNYQMPLDAAIRSLSNELDIGGLRFAPASTGGNVDINPDGSINIIPDAAHVMNGLAGGTGAGASVSFQSTTGFANGTRMQYEDEWIAGYERDFGHGVIFSARYVDRRLRRIVEDMSGISPEAFNIGAFNQIYLIGNPKSNTDVFTNIKKPLVQAQSAANSLACTTAGGVVGDTDQNGFPYFNGLQACFTDFTGGDAVADGLPDGFANPVRNYQAVEIEMNKSFSKGWLMRANYRIARLQGNYEGAFRNDNGQTDPSISSLFDFTPGVLGLLGDQFANGPLNTDRRHVVNGFFSYSFDRSRLKGLTLGTGIRVQGGTPISEFGNHPAYGNAGEVPFGGRGKLGRTPVNGQVDLHSEYVRKLSERYSLHLAADLFNVSDSQPIRSFDQNRDLSFQAPNSNTDFQSITGYQNPFYARFGVKVQF
jgi:carboxypeptidase family protein